MTEYIYIVKCPGCEDEMFNFFTDARMQCDLMMSKKPIITQVEIERNDFGECTDSHDLGTVWSWEEAMKDTEGGYTEAEPAVSVFTKDDLKDLPVDNDPEFDTLDNSVDFELEEDASSDDPGIEPVRNPITEDFISVYDYGRMTKAELYDHLVNKADEVEIDIGDQGYTYEDTGSFSDGGYYSNSLLSVHFEDGKFIAIEFYMSDDGDEKEGTWQFATESFDELWDQLMEFKPEALAECSDRKPIPEGMTIEELVEEMEENEDKVECTQCYNLFNKSECRKELNQGWCCRRCADDLVARGEGPVFKSDNYWDFLDEDIEEVEEPEVVHDLGNEYDGAYPSEKPELPEEDEIPEVSDSHLRLCPECGKETFDIETGICVDCGFN